MWLLLKGLLMIFGSYAVESKKTRARRRKRRGTHVVRNATYSYKL